MLDSRSVICSISIAMREMNQQWVPKQRHTVMLETRLNIPVKTLAIRRGKWILWSKLSSATFKLNTDGSRKGAVTTDRGLARDSNGDMVVSVAIRFNHQDVLQAELDALLQGLLSYANRNFLHVAFEIDSAMALNMILQKSKEAWKYIYTFRKIRRLLPFFSGIQLIPRETNKAADGLKKLAYSTDKLVIYQEMQALPRFYPKVILF